VKHKINVYVLGYCRGENKYNKVLKTSLTIFINIFTIALESQNI